MGGNIQEGRRTNELWGAFGEASIVTCVKGMEQSGQCTYLRHPKLGIDEISSQKGQVLKRSRTARLKLKLK